MGGHAFDAEDLTTPRMPPEIYHQVKHRILSILRQHFRHANSPIEAPAKTDHGDIDILVADPVDQKTVRNPEYLASLVGAKRWKRIGGGDTINLAIPWPTSSELQSARRSVGRPHSDSKSASPDSFSKLHSSTGLPIHTKPSTDNSHKYIQLDISLLPNTTTLSWLLFLHAHGDLWSVLGSILRRFGLTCTPSGFHLHIPDIEGQNKSLSRVKITDDPGTVLAYLGLEEERYWREFGSSDEMLEYVCGSRFVDLGRGKRREDHERRERKDIGEKEKGKDEAVTGHTNATINEGVAASGNDIKETLSPSAVNGTSTCLDKADATSDAAPITITYVRVNAPPNKKSFINLENSGLLPLKSHDRSKATKRPLFAYFLTTYIDANSTIDTPPGSAAKLTKQEVIEDAKMYFGMEFAEKYETARRQGMEIVGVQALWTNVRNMIKDEGGEGDELGYGMKGVKECICGVEFAFLDVITCPRSLEKDEPVVDGIEYEPLTKARESFREMRYDEVLEWAKRNWRKVGRRQKKIDMEISGKKLAAKIEAERAKAMEDEKSGSP